MVQTVTRGPATAAEIAEAVSCVRDVCARLEPTAIGLLETPAVFDDLVALERLAGGAVTRMTARYDEAGSWKGDGARSAEEGIGRKTGTGTGEARRKLSTSKRLRTQPKTDDALRRGEVSPTQANEVSDAASVSPDSEDELLTSAKREPLHQLRKRAADAKARADADREATRRRLHARRAVRRWNDGEGMGNLLLKLPADEMAEIDAALKRPIDACFAAARDAGRFEPPEAYAADVVKDRLLGASDGGRPANRNQAVRPDKKVIAIIDVEALNRGFVEGDETCEIAGVGPVSVSAVQRLMSDAFLALVIKDGVDVLNVTHLGRQVTAHQRTALEARGGACEICGSTFRVDIDHIEGWCLTRETRIDDLGLKCRSCHDLKTRHRLREVGPPGDRRFLRPDGTPWRGPPAGPVDGAAGEPDDALPDRRLSDRPVQADLFTVAR